MVSVHFLHGKQFKMQVGDHELICDQPPANGGQNRGPAPDEMFIGSIGACIAYYVLAYLEARSLPTMGLAVETTWDTARSPKRIHQIKTHVTLPGGVPAINHDRIRQAAERCLLHNTLHHLPEVAIEVLAPVGETRVVEG